MSFILGFILLCFLIYISDRIETKLKERNKEVNDKKTH